MDTCNLLYDVKCNKKYVSFSRGLYLDEKNNFKQNMAIYNPNKQEKGMLELGLSYL